MNLIYTEQALNSLEQALEFIAPEVTQKKLLEIRNRILDRADTLLLQPNQGQKEPYLEPIAGAGLRPVSIQGLVFRAEDYVYSSASDYAGEMGKLDIFVIEQR